MSGAELVSMAEAEAFVTSKLQAGMELWLQRGVAEGRLLERKRISSILRHPSALGREHMALQLAYYTDLELDAAVAQLEATRPPGDQLEN